MIQPSNTRKSSKCQRLAKHTNTMPAVQNAYGQGCHLLPPARPTLGHTEGSTKKRARTQCIIATVHIYSDFTSNSIWQSASVSADPAECTHIHSLDCSLNHSVSVTRYHFEHIQHLLPTHIHYDKSYRAYIKRNSHAMFQQLQAKQENQCIRCCTTLKEPELACTCYLYSNLTGSTSSDRAYTTTSDARCISLGLETLINSQVHQAHPSLDYSDDETHKAQTGHPTLCGFLVYILPI